MQSNQAVVLAKINYDHYDLLVKLLTIHFVYPLPYSVSGAYFEELFAYVVGGQRESRKLLFDVYHNSVGWSLKTKVESSRIDFDSTFSVVLKRSDILKNRSLSLNSPAQDLGNYVIADLQNFYSISVQQQSITDSRIAFLIRDTKERNFFLFQQRYQPYDQSAIKWKWANERQNSIIGYFNDIPVLSWYRRGTQTFGIYKIPPDAHKFIIDWKRADLDITIEFFEQMGLVQVIKL